MRHPRLVFMGLVLGLIVACDNNAQQTQNNQAQDNQSQSDQNNQATTTGGSASQAQRAGSQAEGGCDQLPDQEELERLVRKAPDQIQAGGLFSGSKEWVALVNRAGELCAVAVSTDDPAAAWPGSQAISKAKAYTANAFSTDQQPLSTARLYTMTQPGRSLWGLAAGNPFNPECLTTPQNSGESEGQVCGGTIVFGGGVPLYKGKTRVGGLGASGDTACADHEIAKQIRDAAGLNPSKGKTADDIMYSSVDGPSIYTHPLCPNTWRNGKKIGDAPPASDY